ncbi:MAG: Hpt domain-containing protein [Candidatus Nitricoxidivorans perseverans]|uniref:Chemotaxis protein CheA n=1 Tax=Candidatus Nitricoxidivorans perseverans TaxID=2975601 RepID=A0AA49FJB1_9PROT|nr:MAG: Hpt domain-containing protein [Candidatus Nitricoxidivorans perseverans]
MSNAAELDIGPLTWVKGEIELALDRAAEALDRFGAEGGDLKSARNHLHQAHGALSIVGLDGITRFSEAIEQLLTAVEEGKLPFSPQLGGTARQAIAAVRHYLDDLVDGQPDQPLRLLPAYRALAAARNQPEPPPSDLFFPDLSLRPPRREREPAPLADDVLAARLKAARLGFERGLLKWLRQDPKGLTEMRNSVAVIEMTQAAPSARAFWWITLALLDAIGAGALPADPAIRRLCGRIDAQIRKLLEGSRTVAERLMRDTLYHVAVAGPAGDHVECVRAAYRLASLIPTAGAADIEPLKPLLRASREVLAAAMEDWNRFCAGTAAALPQFHERIGQLAGQLDTLNQAPPHRANIARLAAVVLEVADALRRDPLRHDETLGIEVATALLLAEHALDNFRDLGAEFAAQTDIVAGRLGALLRGEPLSTLAMPRLDDISRHAQERLLTNQVVKEIQVNLAVIEQSLDMFFRNPAENAELTGLAKPVRQIEGALTVLGQDRATAVLRECESAIAKFTAGETPPDPADFEEVARKLSGLGFFVEQLKHGPANIDAILGPWAGAEKEPEPSVPSVETEMKTAARMTQTLVGALREKPGDEALRGEIRHSLETLREDARLVADADLEEQASAAIDALTLAQPAGIEEAVAHIAPTVQAPMAPSAEVARLAEASSEEIDAELLSIFIEEAREVLANIGDLHPRLLSQRHDRETLTTVRRGFHTLKGSGRMVGLAELGEAAWAVEQVLNRWLQQELEITPELAAMVGDAHALFRDWVIQMESGGGTVRDARSLIAVCERLKSGEAPPLAEVIPFPEPEPVRIGDVALSPTLYALYLDEARQHVATLRHELEVIGPPHSSLTRAAHTLAGISATAGIAAVSALAHSLEGALNRLGETATTPTETQRLLLARAIGALEGMIGAVAERRLPGREADLAAELDALVPAQASVRDSGRYAETKALSVEEERRQSRVSDDLDSQLLPIFLEEGQDLMREIGAELRTWRAQPDDDAIADRMRRLLHTFKGSARMAGAMGLGELVHSMETRIGEAAKITPAFLDGFDASFDRAEALLESLRNLGTEPAPAAAPIVVEAQPEPAAAGETPARAQMRVRADVVDRLVNEAGEMAIARGRIEGEMRALKSSLLDLTENVIRLRSQLREIEIQAESQMQSTRALAAERDAQFDPLEFDRFTRFQELTRMMAESVNDVATVQHNLLRNLDHADAAVAAQARLNRELSQSLMGMRMLPFNTLADRLHRIVRQTAKELGKRANLDIRGGQIELDRSVLEKMTGPLEHLLRNAVVHGLEAPEQRVASGKAGVGEIMLTLTQEGNEVQIELADDGRGLDLALIRAKAVERGLAGADADERQLTQLIFLSGFSTAEQLTELSGRGIGMDVVKNETASLGGRIEVTSTAGQGSLFRIYLPLTLAVTQAVLVRSGSRSYAIPSAMVEQVGELKPEAIGKIRADGGTDWLGNHYPWHYLPRLLGDGQAGPPPQRRHWLLLLKAGSRRIALEVDGLAGNQEIVIKNIGPQLARMVGIDGATVLADGEIVLIVNPVALAGRESGTAIPAAPLAAAAPAAPSAGTVMVVDDSLTVRKIAGRLLAREGYRVITAKDGVDALEQLLDTVPDVMLVDIEMPRMDGFDLTRNIRIDPRLKDVPIIMITSRIADKHRSYAREIGVNHYLGKPYDEDELLGLVAGYARKPS